FIFIYPVDEGFHPRPLFAALRVTEADTAAGSGLDKSAEARRSGIGDVFGSGLGVPFENGGPVTCTHLLRSVALAARQGYGKQGEKQESEGAGWHSDFPLECCICSCSSSCSSAKVGKSTL